MPTQLIEDFDFSVERIPSIQTTARGVAPNFPSVDYFPTLEFVEIARFGAGNSGHMGKLKESDFLRILAITFFSVFLCIRITKRSRSPILLRLDFGLSGKLSDV